MTKNSRSLAYQLIKLKFQGQAPPVRSFAGDQSAKQSKPSGAQASR